MGKRGIAKKTGKTPLDWALAYHRLGWCVIPIPHGTKKARIKWKRYQQQCPAEAQLRKWFNGEPVNMAVVLGDVSGGLTCRDFDTMDEYRRWAEKHPTLARTLPTVQTANGMHVYFEGHVQGIKHIANGELRGSGGYTLLPPSRHPDGPDYEWINPVLNGNLLAIDPELAGFLPDVTEHTEYTEKTEKTEQSEAIVRGGSGVTRPSSTPTPTSKINKQPQSQAEEAIKDTLPFDYGMRNRRIFEFARAVKAMPQYSDADPKDLRPLVEEWHRQALPKIRTKEFEETWIDFLQSWPRIRYRKGEEPMAEIFERAVKLEPPRIAIEKYPANPDLQLLVSLCRELQLAAGDGPFYLSVRTAGRLLEKTPMTACRWLFLLRVDGILEEVSKGGRAETVRQATRYKYLGN